MELLLTLVYIAGTYVRPAEIVPALAPYRIMLVLGVAAVAAGAWATARGRGPTLRAPQLYLVPAFALWAVFTVMAQGWLGGAMEAAEELSGSVLVFLAVCLAVTTLRRLRIIAALMVVLSMFVVTQGVAALRWDYKRDVFLVQEGVDEDAAGRDEWDAPAPALPPDKARPEEDDGPKTLPRIRSRGVLNDPNDLAQAIVAVLPFLLAFRVPGRFARNLLLVGVPAAFLLYGVYLTRSRGALISILVVLVVALYDRFGRVAAALAAAAAGAVVAVASVVGFAGREVSLDESATGRTDAWANGLSMLRSSPVWGVGYGNFTEHNSLVAHNSFVHCFAEVGLVGYFVWLAIVVVTWFQVSAVARLEPADEEEDGQPLTAGEAGDLARWAAAARYALTAFIAAAFFLSRTYGVMLFLMLGLAVAVVDLARAEDRLPEGRSLAGWVAGIASLEVVTVLLFAVVVRIGRIVQ